MTWRRIDRELLSSGDLFPFGAVERLLWVGLVLLADEDGLVRADCRWLRSRVLFGLRASTARVQGAIEAFRRRGMVDVVEADGQEFLRLRNYGAYQAGRPARYRERDRGLEEVVRVLVRQWGFKREKAIELARERSMEDLEAWVEWQRSRGLGFPLLCHLLQRFRSPEEMRALDGEPFDAAAVLQGAQGATDARR